MSREEILIAVQEVFQDQFDDDELVIDEAMTSDDVEGWDSLSQIELIMAIEDEFSIKLSLEDVMGVHTVGDIVTLVSERTQP